MNIPNLITLGRLLSVPITAWLMIVDQHDWAFALFLAAGASDAIDGFIAKRFHLSSRLGGYLDALADKALLVCVYVILASQGGLPKWIAILVVSRDVLIIGGWLLSFATSLPINMRPLTISKVNTGAQMVLAAAALARMGYGVDFGQVLVTLIYAVGLTTVASGAFYVVHWARVAGKAEEGK